MSNDNANNNDELKEEVLIELIHLKNCLGLMSKVKIQEGERIDPEEIHSIFSTMHSQVNRTIKKLELTL